MSAYFAGDIHHVANTEATTVADVVDELVMLIQRLECQQMRSGEVNHVDVVANASAVGRRVVRSKDGNVLSLAEGNFQHLRDEVRLGPVVLAELAFGTRRVQIPQAGVAKLVNAME